MNKSMNQVEYSEEFYGKAELLSEYISELQLTKELNDKLVKLIFEQLEISEKEAFLYGFKIGMKYNVEQIFDNEKKRLTDNINKVKVTKIKH
jgi:hypothetical protein